MEIIIVFFEAVSVTYGTGSNPVTARWISRKRKEGNDGKKEGIFIRKVLLFNNNMYMNG